MWIISVTFRTLKDSFGAFYCVQETTGATTDPVLPFIYDDIAASFTLERSGSNTASYHITYLRLGVYYVSC